MSLAGGSYLGLSDGEAADPGSKTDLPRIAMPNILDQCYVQKNPNRSPKKWPSTNGKITNGKKEGSGMDESGNNKLPEPCVVLYKKKLDFTIPQNKSVGCGLINIGNTCYINSTLQCLLYLPPWYNYVTKEHQQECSISSVDCIVCMFNRFLKSALNYHGSPFAPREIVDKLKYFCTNMVRGRQEDAHEFLVSFVDRMQMSLLRSVQRLVDASSQYTTAVYKVFGIVVRSQVRCKTCGWRSNNYEFGLNLILGIKNARSLITAFKLYTKKELMDGANAYSCDRCRQRQPAEKHLTVDKAPNVLIIQLLRYDQNEYGNTKLTQHIEFNESLDLNPFMSETEMQSSHHHVYQLHGVLVHTGMTIQSGHYFAYVRGMDRKWYKMNDERVHEVSFEEVMSTQAYILFYVRKLKEPQQAQKPPVSIPALVKHKPSFNPSLASNANYISHKPVVPCPVNSNGNTRTVLSVPSKPQSASTNGGTPKPSVNGSGDAANVVNSNFSNCATSFGVSSVPNRGTKELSSNQREKVAFKISRPKDRWNGANTNGSKPSTPVAESKMLPASGSVSNLPLVTGKTKKLVAYDDESSDDDSDNGKEPGHDGALPEKSGAVEGGVCDVGVEVESAKSETNKTTSGIALAETTNTASRRPIPSVVLDLEMFTSKCVASERPPLKRSTSDSNLSARMLSVCAASTVPRSVDRRLSSGDGTLELDNGKQLFTKAFELRAEPLIDEKSELMVDIASPTVNLTNNPLISLQVSNDIALAHPADTPETRTEDLNCEGCLPDNVSTSPETNVKCNLPSTDTVVAPVATPCMAMGASPLACHSKKRRKSGDDDSASCKRSHRGNVGSSADNSVEYVWVEKTFESLRQDGIGEHRNRTHSPENSTAGEKPDCCREKQLKRSKAVHNRDRHTKRRSRSVESQTHQNGRSSSSSSHPPAGHRSHSKRRDQNGRAYDQEDLESRSKFPVRLKRNVGRRRSSSSDRLRSFDRDCSRDDRKRRSRSSHRSSVRGDRRHGSRSSRRSRKHRSRSHRRKYSSTRERRRSRSLLGRRDSDVRSSKSYDYHVSYNRRHRRESSR